MGQSRALWFYGELASAERLLQEHTDIYLAIKNQDVALAEKLMHLHLHKVDAVLQQFL
jgi:GntR family transcriptional repressor for pyruvate dehydrogenase complex